MTNEEAIEQIEMMIYYYESLDMDDDEEKDCEALNMATKALEKQIPKEPKRNNTIASKFFHKTSCYTCPTCGNGLLTKMMTERQDTRFCWDCGQKLDWGESK